MSEETRDERMKENPLTKDADPKTAEFLKEKKPMTGDEFILKGNLRVELVGIFSADNRTPFEVKYPDGKIIYCGVDDIVEHIKK